MRSLAEKLKNYTASFYPMHMPGHKRKMPGKLYRYFGAVEDMDVTELSYTDNLHDMHGILKSSMEYAAKVYGVKASFFLVNGSTVGILAAMHAVSNFDNPAVLMAADSHISAYHAAKLLNLKLVRIFPQTDSFGIAESIDPEEIRKKLRQNPDIKAVFITSPTYDGIMSDISSIATETHRAGAVLIVDEAHGAHLPFLGKKGKLKSAIYCGADIVIESLHKTLPALTQTAILHICSERIQKEEITESLRFFETSSPSYVLMANIDACVRYMAGDGRKKLKKFYGFLHRYREELGRKLAKTGRSLCLIDPGINRKDFSFRVNNTLENKQRYIYSYDPSKILIGTQNGPELARILRDKYRIETEMASERYVLALSCFCDSKAGFRRLKAALVQTGKSPEMIKEKHGKKANHALSVNFLPGSTAGEYLYAYPPGIPLVLPGEKYTEEILQKIRGAAQSGCNIIIEHRLEAGRQKEKRKKE